MSEYQYYEFQAVDRPLTEGEMSELRSISSRARITPTSFVNYYNWSDFRGNVDDLMANCFDAFVYVANWGTHRFLLKVPRKLLEKQRQVLTLLDLLGIEWVPSRKWGSKPVN
ncbi:MAG: hypothetical protein ABII00_01755 [Elusimicrobiota bacterium]